MLRIPLLASLAVLLPMTAFAQERVAVLVGVNVYDNRNLADLQYAEKDVADMEPVLTAAGFKVRTLLGSKTGADRATRANVEAALAEALQGRTKKDLVLLAFAGHGVQLEGKDGAAAKEVPYFCPVDAVLTEPGTLLSFNAVLKALDEKGGGQNLLLVDACRNVFDANRGSRGGVNGGRIDGLPEGTAVFFSCSGRQKAYETDKAGGGHGVFFHFVLEGLNGGAVDDDGRVTWERLVPFVRKRVTDSFGVWFADVPEAARQRPHAIGSLTDDPVLVPAARGDMPGEAAYQRGRKAAYGFGAGIDRASAVAAFREASAAGHPLATAELANAYAGGSGVAKDEAEAGRLGERAFKGVRAAADRGRADAQYLLGNLYSLGKGTPQNFAEAARWYRKSADQNDPVAQTSLGLLLLEGADGVSKDDVGAVRLFRAAADKNLAMAQFSLGIACLVGLGTGKDDAEAVRLYRKAADQNLAGAQFALGGLYESGVAGTKDRAEAVRWYRRAAAQGDDAAKKALERLGEK